MTQSPLARAVAFATLGTCLTLPSLAQAEFIKDSKATLELRNFYMNRDLRNSTAVQQSKREEWAQGFLLKAESGFTEGTVGFGLDAYAGLGLKLDSSDERAGTNLLPNGFGDEGPGQYSEATAAAKVRLSKTVGKVGGLMPKLPIVASGDSRLLPQVFNGAMITSQEIDGLTLNGGLTYSDTTYGNFTAADLINPARFGPLSLLPGAQMSFAPEWSVTGGMSYERSLGNGLMGRFNLSAKYSSEYNTGSDLLPAKMQDAFTLVNGRIGFGAEDRSWMLEVWGQNLTDEEYYQVVFNAPLQGTAFNSIPYNPATDTQTYNAFLGAPRTWGVTLRVRY